MSERGIAKPNPPRWIRLACGHIVLYNPPVPQRNDEITCAVCGEPTEVAA